MFTVLQRHVLTHTSHLQARTILVYKVTALILGSQTLTCFLHRFFFFNLMAGILIIYHSPVRPVKVKILKVTL